ncbi:MAG: polysaccharide deacetylase family protein (PEP-CTERM system associated) [Gammaproteobacteria bacterium]|jgi:polysaccharide deacetylase family protein (PEP-CTERM system associated)
MSEQPINALSIDVEEYFQVSAFEPLIARGEWDSWPPSVEGSMTKLLDALQSRNIHATFFVLGWIAERHPQLVKRLIRDGHELACHGYDHKRLTMQSRDQVREDLRKSKKILEDVAGVEVIGFRAASFSINVENLWAFEEIESAGFKYSSSVYPIKHDLYGIPSAPSDPFRPDNVSSLVEIPVTTTLIFNRRFPAGGGGYFRLLPYKLSRALISRVNNTEGRRANMYFHPWEFDPEQPRPTGLPLKTRFRHYLNQSRSMARFENLLNDFRWATFAEVYAPELGGAVQSASI